MLAWSYWMFVVTWVVIFIVFLTLMLYVLWSDARR